MKKDKKQGIGYLVRLLVGLGLVLAAACNRATPVNPQQTATFVTPGIQTSTGGPDQPMELTPTTTPHSTWTLPPTATLTTTPGPTPVTDLVPAGANLRLSKGPLLFADVSRDGKTVIAGSRIMVCSYQAADGSENWCRSTGQTANSTLRGLSLSPDGKMILTGLDNGSLILWNSASGAPVWVTSGALLNTQAWSPDSMQLVTSNRNTNLTILDVSTGAIKQRIKLDGIPPSVLSWSPDGKLFAAGDDSGQIAVYDAGNGQTVLAKHFFPDWHLPTGLAWSQDSSSLLVSTSFVSCSTDCIPTYDGWIVQVDARTGQVKWQVDAKDQVHSLTLSPAGTLALARVGDGALNLYQVQDGSLVQSIQGFGGLGPFWLPDEKGFLSLDGKANLAAWDLSGNQKALSHLEGYYNLVSFAWSPDSSKIAASPASGPVAIWDTATGKLVKKFGELASNGPIAWSPDGGTIATFYNQQVILWDVTNGTQRKTLDGVELVGDKVAFSPDGSMLACLSHNQNKDGTWSSSITLWDTTTWNVVQKISPRDNAMANFNLVDIAWSPDGKTLAAAGSIYFWDVLSGKPIEVSGITGIGNSFSSLSWSSDGLLLATNNGWVYDFRDPNPYGGPKFGINPKGPYGLPTTTVFSPDGRYIATGGERIVLHDPKDGSDLMALDGFANQPEALAFSPDSKLLASLSKADGTIVLWKVP